MAAAAGTCTIIEETFGSVKQVYWRWYGGTAETSLGACTTTVFYNGKLIYCVIDPGSAPSANYDVEVYDKNDVDLLSSGGFNRSASSTQSITTDSLGAVSNSQLELHITNSGSAGTEDGYVYLWIR